eukprot:4730020-Karenia_brevis.AAC.1
MSFWVLPFGKEFVLHDDGPEAGDKRIVLLGTDDGVFNLGESKVWFSDGTFATAPEGFAQVYTIFSQHDLDK